jgi:plastocyanin
MRKVMLAALAAALLVAAPAIPAPVKTVNVDVNAKGFAPGNVNIQTGDVVTFTNRDTADHQVVCQTCPFTSPVLKANATYSYTFAKAGKFDLVDPLNKNKKGTVTVKAAPAAAATVTLAATPSTVSYSHASTLQGKLSTGAGAQKVDIVATECGSTAAKVVGTATTGTGGLFALPTRPARATSYQARWNTKTLSPAVSVAVRPVVALTKLRTNRFSVSVLAAESFVGKSVAIRRYVARTRHWYTIKTVTLRSRVASTAMPGSIGTTSAFVARLGRGVTIRAVLPPAQAGSCYLAAASTAIRS